MKSIKKVFKKSGYYVDFEISDDETQGWVIGPKGMSASVECALATGCSSDDDERPFPQEVLDELELFCEQVGY